MAGAQIHYVLAVPGARQGLTPKSRLQPWDVGLKILPMKKTGDSNPGSLWEAWPLATTLQRQHTDGLGPAGLRPHCSPPGGPCVPSGSPMAVAAGFHFLHSGKRRGVGEAGVWATREVLGLPEGGASITARLSSLSEGAGTGSPAGKP